MRLSHMPPDSSSHPVIIPWPAGQKLGGEKRTEPASFLHRNGAPLLLVDIDACPVRSLHIHDPVDVDLPFEPPGMSIYIYIYIYIHTYIHVPKIHTRCSGCAHTHAHTHTHTGRCNHDKSQNSNRRLILSVGTRALVLQRVALLQVRTSRRVTPWQGNLCSYQQRYLSAYVDVYIYVYMHLCHIYIYICHRSTDIQYINMCMYICIVGEREREMHYIGLCIYIYMCVCVYTHIYIQKKSVRFDTTWSPSLHICTDSMCVCVCVCMCIYIYIYVGVSLGLCVCSTSTNQTMLDTDDRTFLHTC